MLTFSLLTSAFRMPGTSFAGTPPPLTEEQAQLQYNLTKHVRALSEGIGPRSFLAYDGLREAARYISCQWEAAGFSVQEQEYHLPVGSDVLPVANYWIELQGCSRPNEQLVIGAHYDSVGDSCPGANDNASGVAALLELPRLLRGAALGCTVRFAAFVNEEPPFFLTEQMGSVVFAQKLKAEGAQVRGMLALETIGYYTAQQDSQNYPALLSFHYPKVGNFIGFVGNTFSASLLHRAISLFRAEARFPSEGLAAPPGIPGADWSDHAAFWAAGYPAIMITDTAPFRYPHYHEDTDEWDKLDYESFTRVVAGLSAVVCGLASA